MTGPGTSPAVATYRATYVDTSLLVTALAPDEAQHQAALRWLAHPLREALGRPRGARRAGQANAAVRRSAPGPRGHLPQAPLGRLLVGSLALAGGMVAVGTLTRFLLTPLLLIALVAGWAGASAGLLQTRARWRCRPGQVRPW